MAAGAEYPAVSQAALTAAVAAEAALRAKGGPLRLVDYNAVPDAVKLTDCAINVGNNSLSSASAAFTNADIGKPIAVESCGPGFTGTAKTTNGQNTLTLTWLQVKVVATGGTWDYTHTGLGTVSAIAYNVAAATLQTALEALYGAGKVTVTLSGTTYTITLLSGAASTDTTLVTGSGTNLTATTNGAPTSLTVTYQLWTYADVGKRVHVPGAGAGGSILTAWIGSIETINSNIAYLVDSTGATVNAGTTTLGAYYSLNWLRTTIQSVTNATTVVLATNIDAGVKANLTGLEVHYGTDNSTPLLNAITAARTQLRPLDLGYGAYLCTAGPTSTHANGLTMYGAGKDSTIIRMIPTDAEGESGRILIAGNTDSATGRAQGVSLRGFQLHVPTAHTRGSGTLSGQPNNKTGAGGFLISKINYFSIFDVATDNNYGVAFNLQNVSHGLVSFCRASNSWADSFNVNNANGAGVTSPGVTDVTVYTCTTFNSGDDMFTTNQYNASGPRFQGVSFIGCRGVQHRQLALGRGVNITGGDDIVVGDCTMTGTNGSGFEVNATNAKNAINTVTVATPGTGAQLTFAAAPANVTPGTTQMRVFKNDASGTYWIGDVSTITGGGNNIITLTAATGFATTCPFTGANSLVQWGANTDGFRWGLGGSKHVVMSNIISETANINPANDGTLNASLKINGGQCVASSVSDVQIDNVSLANCYQSGVLINSQSTTSTNDTTGDKTVYDINIDNLSVSTTGLSNLQSTRPWPGIYIRLGRNITIRGKVRDTADDALLIASSQTSGEMRFDLVGEDIARIPQAGVPQATAFTLGTSANVIAILERLYLTNPSGTSGGTKYVCTAVVSQPQTGSSIRNVNSDIAGQTLLTESASRYNIVISPVMFRGKGSPEGVVTAPVGAMYERSDGGASTVLYMKESGTGNTGWQAYSSGASALPAPELDCLYGQDPCFTAAAGVLVAGSVYFIRGRGNGTLANILLFPIASLTGNVQVGVYANSGSGFSATPTGSPLQQSGSVAVAAGAGGSGPGLTANTRNPLALGASQAVTHLNYWYGIQVDSATTTWERVAALGNIGIGFSRSQTGAYVAGTMPAASAPGAAGATWVAVLGT